MTSSTQSKIRNNPVIWRIANYAWGLSHTDLEYDKELYDKAAVLYAKILNNSFTGPDNHND